MTQPASGSPTAASTTVEPPPASSAAGDSLPPEAVAFANRVFEAARKGDSEFLLAAIDAGLPPSLTSDNGGNDILMLAAYHGHASLVEGLIARAHRSQANPNKVNDRGQTPLSGAVFKNYTEVIRALVDGGADPRAGTPTAIETATMFKNQTVLDLFGAQPAENLPGVIPDGPGR